jgi:transcriptional regulator with XRE-family HTH domain
MPAKRAVSDVERAAAFGDLLRRLRRRKGLTQRQLAGRLPMSGGNLSRIENGEHGPPSEEMIMRIAAALETDAAELLKAAGRPIDDFEGRMLHELQELRSEMRRGFGRVEGLLRRRAGDR